MSDTENLSLSAQRTRRNILKMGAIGASAVAAALATTKGAVAQNNQGNNNNQGQNNNNQGNNNYHAAPAPAIGSGISAVLAVGGVLLGTKLLTRWRRS